MAGLSFGLKALKQALADYWFKKLFREIQDQKLNWETVPVTTISTWRPRRYDTFTSKRFAFGKD
jgi:hypothetical protein